MLRSKKLVSMNLVLDHGKKYLDKNNKQRIMLKSTANYAIPNINNARVKYAVKYSYPIQVRLSFLPASPTVKSRSSSHSGLSICLSHLGFRTITQNALSNSHKMMNRE